MKINNSSFGEFTKDEVEKMKTMTAVERQRYQKRLTEDRSKQQQSKRTW